MFLIFCLGSNSSFAQNFGNYCNLVCKEFEIEIISNIESNGSQRSSILLYPNPTSSFISFDVEGGNDLSFVLTSDKGENIDVEFVSDENIITLNISYLPNGVYFLTRIIDN